MYVASDRKRRMIALDHEIDDVLTALKNGPVDASLIEKIEAHRAEIEELRQKPDEFFCPCGEEIDPKDPKCGAMHFRRMARHDGTDEIVAPQNSTVEVKMCASCYTTEHERVTGFSVTRERERINLDTVVSEGSPDESL